jgi:hypothetical protein
MARESPTCAIHRLCPCKMASVAVVPHVARACLKAKSRSTCTCNQEACLAIPGSTDRLGRLLHALLLFARHRMDALPIDAFQGCAICDYMWTGLGGASPHNRIEPPDSLSRHSFLSTKFRHRVCIAPGWDRRCLCQLRCIIKPSDDRFASCPVGRPKNALTSDRFSFKSWTSERHCVVLTRGSLRYSSIYAGRSMHECLQMNCVLEPT